MTLISKMISVLPLWKEYGTSAIEADENVYFCLRETMRHQFNYSLSRTLTKQSACGLVTCCWEQWPVLASPYGSIPPNGHSSDLVSSVWMTLTSKLSAVINGRMRDGEGFLIAELFQAHWYSGKFSLIKRTDSRVLEHLGLRYYGDLELQKSPAILVLAFCFVLLNLCCALVNGIFICVPVGPKQRRWSHLAALKYSNQLLIQKYTFL